jgi:hypothetical protein
MGKSLISLLIVSIILIGCEDDEKPCPDNEITYLLLDTAGHWFESVMNNPTIYAFSNNGKTESYDTYYSQWINYFTIENCTRKKKEQRRLMFRSSLYKNDIDFEIKREIDFDYLTIEGDIKINIQHPTISTVGYTEMYTGNKKSIPIPVSIIDSMVVKSKTYYNVFKIDFKEPLYSFDQKLKVLYFNSRFGLIGFETFDGEIWKLY